MSIGLQRPPPPAVRERGGSGWVEIVRFRYRPAAEHLQARLERSGIESRLRRVSERRAGPGRRRTAFSVLVRAAEIDDARFVLAEASFEGPSTDELRAAVPRLWWVVALLLSLLITTAVAAGSDGPAWRDDSCQVHIYWVRTGCG